MSLLSSYFWFYARALWDDTFLLPLSAPAVAGYAAHPERRSVAGLHLAVACMLLIPLTHLMGLALIVPLGTHTPLTCWRSIWPHKISLTAIAALIVWLAFPCWRHLASPHPSSPPGDGTAAGWLFPLTGGRLLSADALDYFYGPAPVSGPLFLAGAAVSSIALGLSPLPVGHRRHQRAVPAPAPSQRDLDRVRAAGLDDRQPGVGPASGAIEVAER